MFPTDDRVLPLLLAVVLLGGLFWWWNRRARKWLERRGRASPAPSERPARGGSPPRLRYSEREFQEMVGNALDGVPEEFDKEWKNVAVIVSTDWPAAEDRRKLGIADDDLLLGSYSGVARTAGAHSGHAPHVIVIYQPGLEMLCGGDKQRMERQIRKTVLHELAHHLGMSHQRMEKIGL